MIQVAIVEDDAAERRHIRECLDYLAEKEGYQFNVTEYATGLQFIGSYRSEYDIVFLDIEMPGINGMETAQEIRKIDKSVVLVFITNMAQYAIAGYEVSAANYILKPINKFDFAMKMLKIVSRITQRLDDSVRVRLDGDGIMLRKGDIKYVEVVGRHILYHTLEGEFEEYGTLKEAEKKIESDDFVRCNRCYLVNLKYVSAVRKDSAFVGGDELQISRPQKKAFLEALTTYIGGVK